MWQALIIFQFLILFSSCKMVQRESSQIRAVLEPNSYARAESAKYMVSSQGYWTSLAAKQILDLRGNAVDAAVAATFAVSVERPQSTGLGGGGFMIIHTKGAKEAIAVDFRERAALHADEKMFQDDQDEVVKNLSTDGIYAVATPGLVAGALEVFEKYGSGNVSLAQVMAPAIKLAREGFTVYPHLAEAILDRRSVIERYPATRKIFLKENGDPYIEGDTFRQLDLAKTLETISAKGRAGFYSGWVGKALLDESNRLNIAERGAVSTTYQKKLQTFLTEQDLLDYKVMYRKPVRGTFHGYDIISMPPPSSGGIHLIEILNIIEGFQLQKHGRNSAQAIHLTASAMQRAYADRAQFLGDPDFVKIPVDALTSKIYAKKIAAEINQNRAQHVDEVAAGNPEVPHESSETTHFTIVDAAGNIVSSTQTVNGWLGSGVTVPNAGFLLNNEMDDFSSKPGVPNKFGVVGGRKNAIAAGKRPLSSMTPTIVLQNE
jgi:gamma-glutamyltranspeptidase/glutathione hydrolase